MLDRLDGVSEDSVEVLVEPLLRLGKRPKCPMIRSVLLKIVLVEATQPLRQDIRSCRTVWIRQVALSADEVNLKKRVQNPRAIHSRRCVSRRDRHAGRVELRLIQLVVPELVLFVET